MLAAAALGDGDLPVLMFEDGAALRRPALQDVANRLGLRVAAMHDLYDLVIVGAGPAGLGAAVYGASEGLKTLLLDRHGPGGQAGTSSRIENYLGFPTEVSGAELTRRAILQAQRPGAEFLSPVEVSSVALDGGYKRLKLQGDREVVARAMIVTTGMTYREHPAAGIAERTGAGVYYGAAATEAQACRGGRVMVVGGGNSAGQCAIHLSRYTKDVHLVVRREGLRDTMSHYLIDQIAATPNIHVRGRTTVEAVEGVERLERVLVRSADTGLAALEEIDAMVVFIGAMPHSEWLPAAVLRDFRSFCAILERAPAAVAAGDDRARHLRRRRRTRRRDEPRGCSRR